MIDRARRGEGEEEGENRIHRRALSSRSTMNNPAVTPTSFSPSPQTSPSSMVKPRNGDSNNPVKRSETHSHESVVQPLKTDKGGNMEEGGGQLKEGFPNAPTPNRPRLHTNSTISLDPSLPSLLPPFQPTRNITQVTSYEVRTFVARLRSGMVVLKHPRGRYSKSSYRILHTVDNGRTLSWTSLDPEKGSRKFPRFGIGDVREIRHAWTEDVTHVTSRRLGSLRHNRFSGTSIKTKSTSNRSSTPSLLPTSRSHTSTTPPHPFTSPPPYGTKILRKKCHPSESFLSFSLIYDDRTVDFTATSADQATVLLRGLNGLAFKLREEKKKKMQSLGGVQSLRSGKGT